MRSDSHFLGGSYKCSTLQRPVEFSISFWRTTVAHLARDVEDELCTLDLFGGNLYAHRAYSANTIALHLSHARLEHDPESIRTRSVAVQNKFYESRLHNAKQNQP